MLCLLMEVIKQFSKLRRLTNSCNTFGMKRIYRVNRYCYRRPILLCTLVTGLITLFVLVFFIILRTIPEITKSDTEKIPQQPVVEDIQPIYRIRHMEKGFMMGTTLYHINTTAVLNHDEFNLKELKPSEVITTVVSYVCGGYDDESLNQNQMETHKIFYKTIKVVVRSSKFPEPIHIPEVEWGEFSAEDLMYFLQKRFIANNFRYVSVDDSLEIEIVISKDLNKIRMPTIPTYRQDPSLKKDINIDLQILDLLKSMK